MKKTYVYIGNWSFNGAASKGITIFEYEPGTGALSLIETICPDVAAGQLYLDRKNGILYSNDECGEQRGQIGGGGYVLAGALAGGLAWRYYPSLRGGAAGPFPVSFFLAYLALALTPVWLDVWERQALRRRKRAA